MLLVAIFVCLLIGVIPARIAKSKGRVFSIWYLYGVFLFLPALIHSLRLEANEHSPGMKKCIHCASIIKIEARICPHCRKSSEDGDANASELISNQPIEFKPYSGERNLENIQYQQFLAKQYSIGKDAIFGKYTINGTLYPDLVDALRSADQLYSADLAKHIEQLEVKETDDERQRHLAEIWRGREEAEQAEELQRASNRAIYESAKRKKLLRIATFVFIVLGPLVVYVLYAKYSEELRRSAMVEERERERERKNQLEIEAGNIRIAENNRYIERTNPQLYDLFLNNNFFGFQLGKQNLELLAGRTAIDRISWKGSQRNIWTVESFNYIEFNQDIDKVLSNSDLAQRVTKISFSYCIAGGKPISPKSLSQIRSAKLIGIYMQLDGHGGFRSFKNYVSSSSRNLESDLAKIGINYRAEVVGGDLFAFELPLKPLNSDSPFKHPYQDPCGNSYNP